MNNPERTCKIPHQKLYVQPSQQLNLPKYITIQYIRNAMY